MPDGRPGDHPLSDVVVHGQEVFDAETNACIRRISKGAPPPILELLGTAVVWWPLAENSHSPWDGMANPDGFRSMILGIERCWRAMEAEQAKRRS